MPTMTPEGAVSYVPSRGITGTAPAAAAAGTAANPAALTATNPTAPTAYAAVNNMTDPVTKAEGEAVSAALATLRNEVAAYELVISALVADLTAVRAEVVKLVTDVATRRTEINALRTALINAGALR